MLKRTSTWTVLAGWLVALAVAGCSHESEPAQNDVKLGVDKPTAGTPKLPPLREPSRRMRD